MTEHFHEEHVLGGGGLNFENNTGEYFKVLFLPVAHTVLGSASNKF